MVAVQPPGRENRLADALHREISSLVEEIVAALDDFDERSLGLFGHSFGASVAYELAHVLTDLGRPPSLLIVSGRRPPHGRRQRPIAHLDDAHLIERLQELGGTPSAVFEHEELLQLLLPVFRADLQALESYRPTTRPLLSCPVRVFGGERDPIAPPDELKEWRRYAGDDFRSEVFPGSHFYLHEEAEEDLRRAVKREAMAAAQR